MLKIRQPEESMDIQHAIGADIIMQLDDVGTLNWLALGISATRLRLFAP